MGYGAANMTVTGVDLNRADIPDAPRQPDVRYAGPILVFTVCSVWRATLHQHRQRMALQRQWLNTSNQLLQQSQRLRQWWSTLPQRLLLVTQLPLLQSTPHQLLWESTSLQRLRERQCTSSQPVRDSCNMWSNTSDVRHRGRLEQGWRPRCVPTAPTRLRSTKCSTAHRCGTKRLWVTAPQT